MFRNSMDLLYSIDVAIFRFINDNLSNPLFGQAEGEGLMPFLSWNSFFIPGVILFALWMIVKGGTKGRIFVAMMLLTISIGDGVICNELKDAFGRDRPFKVVEDINLLVGKGGSGSMPSSHTANWFSAMTVAFLFYRRSWRFMLPMSLLIGFSRVYVGVHYPSDVLVGALLGIGYATAIVLGAQFLWCFIGERVFPLWWKKYPSLLPPLPWAKVESENSEAQAASAPKRIVTIEKHWDRLAYIIIVVLLLARWGYIADAKIELSEDEAYQWVWSKHPALSYYSKPPFIAYAQIIGTTIAGNTELGVRFLSPLLAAIMSLLLYRFLKREVNQRVAFFMLVAVLAASLPAVGSILMTIDPLNVTFWIAAMISGWYAVQQDSLKMWAWTGVWMGCGFLSKYTALFQLLSFAVFFAMWKPARKQITRPGPWLALGILALSTIPVLVWNAQNDWITVTHLGERGGLHQEWTFRPKFVYEYLLQEFALLNPIFFVASIWACVMVWRKHRDNPLLVYLFSMGVPLVIFYTLYTIRSRVQPNWIAPAIIPLFCLMAIYWEQRFRDGLRPVKRWMIAALAIGMPIVLVLHDTNLIAKATGHPLPGDKDPLRRVRGWKETANVVEREAAKLREEGKPVFLIGGHYGITGQMSFYTERGQENVGTDHAYVYFRTTKTPDNQFFFFPGYTNRVGENAIFMRLVQTAEKAPPVILEQFESVEDLGVFDIKYRGRQMRTVQLFACRNLK